MKKVLVVYYSNSGDVKSVLEALTKPLQSAGFDVRWQSLAPIPGYPFPWPRDDFFEAFPDALGGDLPALSPLTLDPDFDPDLVILGWQVWFLQPSPPIQAFLRSPFAEVLRGKRIITVTCSRQMWRNAYRRLKASIVSHGGHPTDNVAVTHQGGFATFITTPHMLTTGKKDAVSFLPTAGLSAGSIAQQTEFGSRLRDTSERWRDLQTEPLLAGMDAAKYSRNYALAELVGSAYMRAWGIVARHVGARGSWSRSIFAKLFGLSLLLLVPVVVPITLLIAGLGSLTRRLVGHKASVQ